MEGFREFTGRFRHVEIQPGDATLYLFSVSEHSRDYLFVAGNLCRGYLLDKDSVRECGPVFERTYGRQNMQAEKDMMKSPYINYLVGHMGSAKEPANPWTVRAAVLAAWFMLRQWDQQDRVADEVASAEARMEDR